MRALQSKQPPAVRFTYQDSPSLPTRPLQARSHSLPKSFALPAEQPHPQPSLPRKAAFVERSHIKVVDEDERRERRHKIFEEVGALARSSKSKERNRSFSIFNGARENTNQVKDLVMSKESCKEQSVQTEMPKLENKISTFMQPAETTPQRTAPRLGLPLEETAIQQELTLKEKELAFLKLELERHERCERITYENESIYKRLVEKLGTIHAQSTVTTLQRTQQHSSKQKSPRRSPHRTHRDASPSDTTRFLRPSSAKRDNIKEVLANVLNQVPPEQPPTPMQNLKNDLARPQTMTFYRQDLKKTVKGNRSVLQGQLASEQQLRERLQQSVRRYTNTMNFDDVPLKDKLASMNRYIENKHTQREQGRPASQSRYTQRGKSIAISRTRPYLLL